MNRESLTKMKVKRKIMIETRGGWRREIIFIYWSSYVYFVYRLDQNVTSLTRSSLPPVGDSNGGLWNLYRHHTVCDELIK